MKCKFTRIKESVVLNKIVPTMALPSSSSSKSPESPRGSNGSRNATKNNLFS